METVTETTVEFDPNAEGGDDGAILVPIRVLDGLIRGSRFARDVLVQIDRVDQISASGVRLLARDHGLVPDDVLSDHFGEAVAAFDEASAEDGESAEPEREEAPAA